MTQTSAKTKIILTKPLITEKATLAATAKMPVYSFIVPPRANKTEVAKAVVQKYKVKPLKVAIINLPRKYSANRRRPGFTAVRRKALVYLPAGTTLTL